MKAWVPVKEVKTMESEKEEEEEKRCLEEQQQEEKNKKILSSLPPNYVTLAQLRENWMKKKQNEINQQKQQEDLEEKNEDHQPLEERHVAVTTPQYGTVSRFYADNRNREDSTNNRHAIGVDSENGRKTVAGDAIKVYSENSRKSVAGDAIGVYSEHSQKSATGNEDLDGKVKESKPMKKKKKQEWKKEKARKSKVEENGAIEEGSGVEENGNGEKIVTQIESKDVTNWNAKTVDEVEEKIRVLSVKSVNGKQNWKIKKLNGGVFRQSQSMRNGRNAGGYHGHGHGHGHGDLKHERSSKAEMIWVKKDKSVGEIET